MKRIDFLGAPGVGKSTICNAVLDNYSNLCISEQEALILSAKIYVKEFNFFKSFMCKIGLSIPKINSFFLKIILDNMNPSTVNELTIENNDFFNKIHEIYCFSNNPFSLNKIKGLNAFIRKMCNCKFIKDYNQSDRFILFDESISQRIFGIYGVREIDNDDAFYIDEYFQEMPLPYAMIIVENKKNAIFDNIKNRQSKSNKLIPGHKNINDKELMKKIECSVYITQRGYQILKQRDVKILKISSHNSLDINKEKIIDFLKSLNA